MDRREFLVSAVAGTIAAGLAATASADGFYPQPVDQSLFRNINRVKDPAKKTPLEMSHAPFIKAPASVKAGEPFEVTVQVGEKMHGMAEVHWIEYIALSFGNAPAGRLALEPKGYMLPHATFLVTIPKEAAPKGVMTLVAEQRCNLHGLWESTLDIKVV
ncbi:desulfoferrodoxin [Geomonas sp. Red276]